MTAGAGEMMGDTYAANMKGVQEYNAKMMEFANANTTAAFEFMRQLMTAKSPTEFFTMSSNHMRQEFEDVHTPGAGTCCDRPEGHHGDDRHH